ncbi:S8 family peptidase [Caenibacillus caldisaponilyticus]|uniref:S8 family peptidase n=1 Tax=Caenibacillus caldisaponilyticus TaxID=1674942 RepID=UPI001EE7547F|nr:S8 family peptidase [Caenibacillus caldisaponilyticus]
MGKVRLIPYTVEEVVETPTETVPAGVAMIDAPSIWDKSDRGRGVVVAVIDTGCQIDHPDLKDRIIDGRNFTDDYNGKADRYEDNNGHGTHVCGTIAANQNESGIIGVAPEARLLVLKALSQDGSGETDWIVEAIQYAVDWRGPDGEKVQVISMSLGGPDDDDALHLAIQNAVKNDILVVCAAGNEGDGRTDTPEASYPGDYNEVIEVGAVDFNRRLAPFSNSNDNVDVVAPGVNVVSTFIGGRYARLSGTSMATPHVSGALALLANLTSSEFGRKLTEPELYAQLVRRTVGLGYDKAGEGNGLVSLGWVDKIEAIVKLLTPSVPTETGVSAVK